MLLRQRPRCTSDWLGHWKGSPRVNSSCPLAASVQSDDSSSDEKLNFVPDDKPIVKRHRSLSSDSVAQTLRCLRSRPAVAFAYFRDAQSIGFHHDLSTYSEIILILSHSFQGKMLVSLFCELISATAGGGPEILPLMDHFRKLCATPHALSFAVNCLIKAYTACYDVQATAEMFTHLCKLGFVPSVWACNFLLKFVAQSGESEMVIAAYDQMKCFQLTLDAYSLKIITRSLFQVKKADEACQVWIEMIEMGVKPDLHGYSSFVIGLCDCGKYDLAYAFQQGLTRNMIQIEAMAYNMVIDGLCKEMKLEEAEKVLENKVKQGSPDVYGYSYLICSYCKMGDPIKALDHIGRMESHGIKVNCHILAYLLHCFRMLGKTSEVTVHFHKFRDLGIQLDGVLYNIAMEAYCKDGNMDEAVELLTEMMAEGLVPDKIHYTTLINGYCLQGEIENACQVFEQMLKVNIKPDVVTYNILASGFSRSGLVMEVYNLLEHMVDQGLKPNSLTYAITIDGFCRRGNLSEADLLFQAVEEVGIDNIEVLYSSMMCGYLRLGWTGDAYTLFERVVIKQGNMVDHFSCSKLITELCTDGNLERASTVFSTMLEKNVVPDVICYSKLISAYCQTGDMYSALSWFHDMIERGIPADVIVYTALMNGYWLTAGLVN